MEIKGVFHKVYLRTGNFLIFTLILVILNITSGFLTKSFSILIMGLALVIFVVDAIIVLLVNKRVMEGESPGENPSKIHLASNLVLMVLFIAMTYLAYVSSKNAKGFLYPIIAFFTPLVTLIFSGFTSGKIEESLMEELPYLGRRFGDSLRLAIIYSSLSLFGVIINILTVYWLDYYLAILISLIALRESLIRIWGAISGKAQNLINNAKKALEAVSLEVPVVRKVSVDIEEFGGFLFGEAEIIVAPHLSDNEIKEIGNYVLKTSIDKVPNLVALRLLINRDEDKRIKIAIPISDTDKVAGFDEAENFSITEVALDKKEILKEENVTIKTLRGKIQESDKVVQLAKHGIDVLITNSVSDKALSSLKGWFIRVIIDNIEKKEEAIKKILK